MGVLKLVTISFFIFILLFVLSLSLPEPTLKTGESETNLPYIRRDQGYDFVLLGSSHARIFSRYGNQPIVEKILNKKFLNLAQGGNREAIRNQLTYLDYFFRRGNRVGTVLYLLDPFIFYRLGLLDNPKAFIYEPVRLDFLLTLISAKNHDFTTILTYLRSYSHSKLLSPDQLRPSSPSASLIAKRVTDLYRDNALSDKDLVREFTYLSQISRLTKKNNTKLVIIIPPTLLPSHRREEYVKKRIKDFAQKNNIFYFDLSNKISDPQFFYDTDHFNREGLKQFSTTYLRKLL